MTPLQREMEIQGMLRIGELHLLKNTKRAFIQAACLFNYAYLAATEAERKDFQSESLDKLDQTETLLREALRSADTGRSAAKRRHWKSIQTSTKPTEDIYQRSDEEIARKIPPERQFFYRTSQKHLPRNRRIHKAIYHRDAPSIHC